MAIVVEEEKSRTNIVSIIGWVAVLGIVGAGIYYLFFTAPELVPVAPAGNLADITPLTQITLHPEDVLNTLQRLKTPSLSIPTPQGPGVVGRPNPFLSP